MALDLYVRVIIVHYIQFEIFGKGIGMGKRLKGRDRSGVYLEREVSSEVLKWPCPTVSAGS